MQKSTKNKRTTGIVKAAQRGFTLMEVLLYVALVSIIALFLSGTVISLLRGRSVTNSQVSVQDSLRFVEEAVMQDVRNASAVVTPSSTSIPTTTLVLTVAGETITYDISANAVRRQVNAGTPQVISPTTVNATSASFTRIENTSTQLAKTVVSVQATFVMSASNTSGEATRTETRKFTAVMP